MKTRLLFFITLLLISECILAQNDVIIIRQRPTKKGEKWETSIPKPTIPIEASGPITKEDFKVDEPGASAIYLLNEGHTEIQFNRDAGSSVATTKKFVRIKVLTNAGFDLGNFKIPLYVAGKSAKNEERIREIKAATYNLNEETGQIDVSLLNQEQIYRTVIRENVEEVSFALPNVKVNTIIQVSYYSGVAFYYPPERLVFSERSSGKEKFLCILCDCSHRICLCASGAKAIKKC